MQSEYILNMFGGSVISTYQKYGIFFLLVCCSKFIICGSKKSKHKQTQNKQAYMMKLSNHTQKT